MNQEVVFYIDKLIKMNIEKIEIKPGQYVWVDKEKSLSKNGDYYLTYPNYNTIHRWNMTGMHEGKSVWINKILASSPELNLEGVPDYVELLAKQTTLKYINEREKQTAYLEFIEGYKTAEREMLEEQYKELEDAKLCEPLKSWDEQEMFTEEDMKKAIELTRDLYLEDSLKASMLRIAKLDKIQKQIIELVKSEK